jgi:exodeoxyribonuclease VIII
MDWSSYCEMQQLNGSTLVLGMKSMRAMKRAIDGGCKEQTDAMRLGSGIHCLLLEPDEFESRYCVVPAFHKSPDNVTAKGQPTDSKLTNFYKQSVKEFAKQNAGKEFVSREQYDNALYAIESLRSKPSVVSMLEGADTELTLTGDIDGVPIKGRIDALCCDYLLDLKTTASVDLRTFGRTFANLHYGFKLAIYRHLVRCNGSDKLVRVVAQETSGDFDSVVYDVPNVVLDNGFVQVKRVLAGYKHALKTGEWHGVDRGEESVPLLVPQWAMEDAGEELVSWSSPAAEDAEVEAAF